MSKAENNSDFTYCNNIYNYSRLLTKVVNIGDTPLGGNYPIRIQSMTNTNTLDTKATVEQSIRMIEAGCEYVRITAPGIKEAKNLALIKKSLKQKGYQVPLIADIHFNPKAAEIAAAIVEKVRINPGNYTDKKNILKHSLTDNEYSGELDKIRKAISPLINICKKHGTAIRIGTNHGSLSDRIVGKYGDTPNGMVESAVEFIKICEDLNFQNIVLSMKASNTRIMVEAYRLLVNRMIKERFNYPLHLGVTEAGEGEDGRIKSAAGIGTLLEDGIGDTIRVSLTEAPELELPVAKIIADRYYKRPQNNAIIFEKIPINPFEYNKRETNKVLNIGRNNVPVVIADLSHKEIIKEIDLPAIGYERSVDSNKWIKKDTACDFIYAGKSSIGKLPGEIKILLDAEKFECSNDRRNIFPVFNKKSFTDLALKSDLLNFIFIRASEVDENFITKIKKDPTVVLVICASINEEMTGQRKCIFSLIENQCLTPVIIKRSYPFNDLVNFQLSAAIDYGALLLDGLIDGVWITIDGKSDEKMINSTAFNILQASRARISKTEYISCPSCGRTMFNILEASAIIKSKTQHLKGLKIGIMGCIVNGPGEMADADYGYVGAGSGKVNLYKGKQLVRKGIPATEAVDALIELIKDHGDWI